MVQVRLVVELLQCSGPRGQDIDHLAVGYWAAAGGVVHSRPVAHDGETGLTGFGHAQLVVDGRSEVSDGSERGEFNILGRREKNGGIGRIFKTCHVIEAYWM